MKLELDTTELKQSLSKYHLSDIVLFMSWVFVHLGMFSALKAEEFFIYAGVINFIGAMIYKLCKWVTNGK